MRSIILFIASSLDGYIARTDGRVDWLFTDQEYGYHDFFAGIDTVLVGHRTYQQAIRLEKNPFPKKKVFVFSKEKNGRNGDAEYVADPVSFTRELILKEGKDIWLVGGSEINTLLLNASLIHKIILSVHPIVLGEGIPLFGRLEKDVRLNVTDAKAYASGLVQLHYMVDKKGRDG